MANFNHQVPNKNLTGLEILANIMQHCTPQTNRNIMSGLQASMPDIVTKLRQKIITFEDLAYADSRGIQKLIKIVNMRDLAIAVVGCSEALVKNIAQNLSQNRMADFKSEITLVGQVSQNNVYEARDRIMSIVLELIESRDLFINRPGSDYKG